ncbi:MAG: mechanosensitive ion channel family protein [Micrococcales bacterium]|nr:mechanosensitive ion channel family protein [Micrococcales bacterium]
MRSSSSRTTDPFAALSNLNKLGTLSWEQTWNWFLNAPLHILLIIAIATISRWLLHRSINVLVRSLIARKQTVTDSGTIQVVEPVPTMELPVMRRGARRAAKLLTRSGLVDNERQRQRVETLGSVLRSIASVVIWGIAVLMIGQELGLNMAPVLASAGVGGVALGFGAQSLVKDFLSGMFMIVEDQYGVGDLIDTGEVVGTVEEVSLRTTRLRDLTGVVWYVRNGEIVRIANRSQGWQTATIDFPVAIDEDPAKVTAVLGKVVDGMQEDPRWRKALLEEPTVAGVESMSGGTMTIRVFGKCAPNKHWGVQRDIRERGQMALAKAGIRGPILMPGFIEADPTSKPPNVMPPTNT